MANAIYLRVIRSRTLFNALKTIKGVDHPTFQAICILYVLLEDDIYWDRTSKKTSILGSRCKIKQLLIIILVFLQV